MVAAAILGIVSGLIGTGLGGLITFLHPRPGRQLLASLLAFAGGIMLSMVIFDLLPASINTAGGIAGACSFGLGVIAISRLEKAFFSEHGKPILIISHASKRPGRNGYLRTGLMVALGIALHDLTEGLAIGAGYALQQNLGIRVAVIMTLHNIPEGIAIAGPLRLATVRPWKAFLVTLLASSPTGLGALTGALAGDISAAFLGVSLAIAAGAMTAVAAIDLLPDAISMAQGHAAVGALVGILAGLVLTQLGVS